MYVGETMVKTEAIEAVSPSVDDLKKKIAEMEKNISTLSSLLQEKHMLLLQAEFNLKLSQAK